LAYIKLPIKMPNIDKREGFRFFAPGIAEWAVFLRLAGLEKKIPDKYAYNCGKG
jgi:hypothetical protein